jgi:hypothetical protein
MKTRYRSPPVPESYSKYKAIVSPEKQRTDLEGTGQGKERTET